MYNIAVFFLILFSTVLIYKKLNAKGKNNTIPTNWPVLGMLPGLLPNIHCIHDYVSELLQQTGGTFFFKGPWFTDMDMLLTSDPDNVHYVLNTRNFPKGPDYKEIFSYVLGDGIFVAEAESWEILRKTSRPLLKDPGYQNYTMATSWKKIESGLIPILEHVAESGKEADLCDLFNRFTFDCSCTILLGKDPVSLQKDLPYSPHAQAFEDAEEAVLLRHILPITIS